MTRLPSPHRVCRDQAGAALVEFALVLPILILLLFGMLDFGKAFNYWIDGTHLANKAARWAAVNKNPGAGQGKSLQQYVADQADTAELRSGIQVSICLKDGDGDGITGEVGDPVRVVVTYDHNWMSFLED